MRWFGLAVLVVFMLVAGWVFAGDSVPFGGSSSAAPLVGVESAADVSVEAPEPPGDSGHVRTDYRKKGHNGFDYVQETENPGSRSAGMRGHLTFKGLRLRGYDGRQIRTPIGSFHYTESQLLWESQGWFPMADIPFKATDVMIDSSALSSGSYKGELRVGTPEDWCYDPGVDTWYDPELLVLKPTPLRGEAIRR